MEPKYPLPPIKVLHFERKGYQRFKATLDANGEVKWHGIAVVLVEGRRRWAIPKPKLELLRQLLEKYDFLNLDETPSDDMRWIHVIHGGIGTSVITAIFADGSSKTISYDIYGAGASPKLYKLERRIETVLGVRKWSGPLPLVE